jgi:hypothetical protein
VLGHNPQYIRSMIHIYRLDGAEAQPAGMSARHPKAERFHIDLKRVSSAKDR